MFGTSTSRNNLSVLALSAYFACPLVAAAGLEVVMSMAANGSLFVLRMFRQIPWKSLVAIPRSIH
jgi:hypothetical protein